MKKVYLSGGIKDFTEEERHAWRDYSKKHLTCETSDPAALPCPPTAKDTVEGDKKEIDSSTHILVYFIRPSVGTSMEVLYSYERGKKVYLINECKEFLSPWLTYHSHKVFDTLDAAIREINNE